LIWILVTLLLPIVVHGSELSSASRSVASDLQVAPGKWAAGRLRNMTEGSSIEIRVQADRPLVFFLLTQEQMERFPKVNAPVMMAWVNGEFSASSVIREGGDYYLLFWNKNGGRTATARFMATVQAPGTNGPLKHSM